uniref:Uncharacterized protein n=1 Tax=Leptocylindrus danicus TaxID=163516 RepID=A0A7S2JTT4_9STRA|mmetsp:Transcript_10804/g.16254  ORF Transcript_10804/g.16254 Transcript_10804/m.16254 type:complete len:233 (+) Transcript_10804:546-1244(+)
MMTVVAMIRLILLSLFTSLCSGESRRLHTIHFAPFEAKLLPTSTGLSKSAIDLTKSAVLFRLDKGLRYFHDGLCSGEQGSRCHVIEDIVLDVEEYFWYMGNQSDISDDNDDYIEEPGSQPHRRLRVENVPVTPCDGCPDYSIMKFSALHASPFETLWGVTSIHFGTNLISVTLPDAFSASRTEEPNKEYLPSTNNSGTNIIYIFTAACSATFVLLLSIFTFSITAEIQAKRI